MNVRLSIILLFVLALVGGYFYFIELRKPGETKTPPLWFYNTDDSNFNLISVTYQGKNVTFAKDKDGGWHFADPKGEAVDINRWGGITLLLRGPQSRRLLSENPNPKDIASYGLEHPGTTITVGMVDGSKFALYLGDKTPDRTSHYAQMEGFPQLFLIDASWGDVLDRLVTEPPHQPTPTPVDTPVPSGTPAN